MYVLDTNTLIYYFKGMGNVAEHLFSKSPRDIAIPSIVLFELEVGIAKSSNPKKRAGQLHEITSIMNVLEFGREEARVAADIRARLETSGTPIGPYDILIAGIALRHQATLISHNIAEFKRIKGLKIADWF